MAHRVLKRIMLAVAGLLLTVSMEATDIKEYKYFIRNDARVCYCTSNGVTVIVDPSGGGIYEPAITIVNESGHEILFEPRKIKAFTYGIPKQRHTWERRHVQLWFESGYDAGLLEREPVEVYTYEQYRKRTSRNLWWSGFIAAVGTAVADGALTTDEYGRYDSLIRQDEQIRENREQRSQALRQIDEYYWRSNTIFDGEQHSGFVATENAMSDQVVLQIPVNGELFEFMIQEWN